MEEVVGDASLLANALYALAGFIMILVGGIGMVYRDLRA